MSLKECGERDRDDNNRHSRLREHMFSLIADTLLLILGELVRHRVFGGLGNGVVVDVLGDTEGAFEFVDAHSWEMLC